MFGISCIPALGQAVGMVFLPYSPRWLLIRGQEVKVRHTLERSDFNQTQSDLT